MQRRPDGDRVEAVRADESAAFLAALYSFILPHRLPTQGSSCNQIVCVVLTNAVIAGIIVAAAFTIGLKAYLLVPAPLFLVGGAGGSLAVLRPAPVRPVLILLTFREMACRLRERTSPASDGVGAARAGGDYRAARRSSTSSMTVAGIRGRTPRMLSDLRKVPSAGEYQ